MDALRQLDEMRGIKGDLPAADATLTLAVPMSPALRDLTPDELDVLQLVINWGTMQCALDHSPVDDLTVCSAVLNLMQRDYIRLV
jgi:hypothetical protein